MSRNPLLFGATLNIEKHVLGDRIGKDRFSSLWITRIYTVIHKRGVSYSYNRREVLPYSYCRLIHDMDKR
ncbi:hypothetical protein H5410_028062 [Solanum commersonii]|uniref:Uncharacterized protein n=1 Tax=Solanum commersonii TaxID=4109 RepID=A0A9J5Z1L5_SOLCO|nr:hypothetical protein H5410_028062 [Solanum commersonii]